MWRWTLAVISIKTGVGSRSMLVGNTPADFTRGLFGGGYTNTTVNVIDYIGIATIGNATDFGDLSVSRRLVSGCSSSTRGLFGGGLDGSSNTINVIDYVTILTTGNATDFGDLTGVSRGVGACSSSTRGIFAGGYTGSVYVSTIDYVTIATTGNGKNFGSLTVAPY